MEKLKNVESNVRIILETCPETRNNDFKLISKYYWYFCDFDFRKSFFKVLENAKELNLVPFESITRARRKLQSEHEELQAVKEVQEKRKEREEEFKEYAIH